MPTSHYDARNIREMELVADEFALDAFMSAEAATAAGLPLPSIVEIEGVCRCGEPRPFGMPDHDPCGECGELA